MLHSCCNNNKIRYLNKKVSDLSKITNVLHMKNFYKNMNQFLSAIKIFKNLLY